MPIMTNISLIIYYNNLIEYNKYLFFITKNFRRKNYLRFKNFKTNENEKFYI